MKVGELRVESCVLITGKDIVYMIYGKTPFGNFFIFYLFIYFFERDTFKFAYQFSPRSTSFMKHYPVVSDGGGGGLVANLCLTLLTPWIATPLSMEFPRQDTGVGCHSLLQGIFPTWGWNLDLLHCRWSLYQLRLQGSSTLLLSFTMF